jgi:hypothetical protein
VSFWIIVCLLPVIWSTDGSEILLTHFLLFFKFIPVSFFSSLSLFFPANPTGSSFVYGQAIIQDMCTLEGPIEIRLTNGPRAQSSDRVKGTHIPVSSQY